MLAITDHWNKVCGFNLGLKLKSIGIYKGFFLKTKYKENFSIYAQEGGFKI